MSERESYRPGMSASLSRRVTAADIDEFAEVSGDTNPLHLDEATAAEGRFGGRIAHGMLGASLISAVLGTRLPGFGGIYLEQQLKFTAPVYPGDRITATVTVREWQPERRILVCDTTCEKDSGGGDPETVIEGSATLLVDPVGGQPGGGG